MLVVKVELWPGGSEKRARRIARMEIANVTYAAEAEHGDYEVHAVHWPMNSVDLAKATGRVERHARLRDSVWQLVAKAIASIEK